MTERELKEYRLETKRIQAEAKLIRARKAEDKTTAAYLADRAKIAEAQRLNAMANLLKQGGMAGIMAGKDYLPDIYDDGNHILDDDELFLTELDAPYITEN